MEFVEEKGRGSRRAQTLEQAFLQDLSREFHRIGVKATSEYEAITQQLPGYIYLNVPLLAAAFKFIDQYGVDFSPEHYSKDADSILSLIIDRERIKGKPKQSEVQLRFKESLLRYILMIKENRSL